MKKISIFFCDIVGTLDGSIANKDDDYKRFNNSLLNLKEDGEELIFSLVSSSEIYTVGEKSHILKRYLNKDIIMGKLFFENGYIIGNKVIKNITGKANQMISYINELNDIYEINKIYFADDNEINHLLINHYTKNKINKDINSFIPKKHIGLSELNEIIDFHEKSKVLKKHL